MSERLEELRKLHDAEPADPFCTYGMALELIKLDDPEQALHWLDKTLELDSAYLYAYFQKGKILDETGRAEEARETLERGLAHAQKAGDEKAASEIQVLLDTL